jgi:nucleotide-binding universal stress UspA family protein
MSEQLVVVGLEGSPASYPALRWTLTYAAPTGARVRAVRCWTPILAKRARHASCPVLVIPPAMANVRTLTRAAAEVPA